MATNKLIIENSSGNVGIGTTSPLGRLHVSSGTLGNAIVIIEADTDNDNENDVPKLWFRADGGINEAAIQKSDNTLDIISNVDTGGGINFLTGTTNNTGTTDPINETTSRLFITSSGNIGINTTSPDHKLHVKGDITIDNESSSIPSMLHFNALNKNNLDPTSRINFWEDDGHTGDYTNANMFIEYNGSTAGGDNGYLSIGGYTTSPNQDILTVSRIGNVGIGTIAPTSKLHIVNGGILVTDENAGQPMLQMRNFATSATGTFAGTYGYEFRHASSTTTHGMLINNNEANDSRRSLDVSDSSGIFATFVNGKVGIGITNPTNCKVAIQADWVAGHSTLKIFPTTSMASGGGGGLGVFDSDGITRQAYIFVGQSAMEIWCQQNTSINFGTNNEQRMQIAAGGNVGIGTTSPSEKLHVHGNIGFTGGPPKIGILDGGIDCYLEITDENPTVLGVAHGGEFKFYSDKVLASSYLQGGSLYLENSLRFRRCTVTEITDSKGTSAVGGTANPKIVDSSLAYGTYLVSAYIQYRGTAPSGDPDQTCIRLIKGGTEICRACILDQDSAYTSFEDFASFAVMVDVDGSTNITVDMFTTDPNDAGGADVNYQVNITRLGY